MFFVEQSENVDENKGSGQKQTSPNPSLSKEGNCELPFSGEEGLGVVGGNVFGEQSENVDENKG